MTHTDQSRAESAYQDRGWYWIEKEGWGSETIIAPALYKAECDAWYSVEFSGSPTREVKVLEPIRRATTEQSSGVELPEPRGYLDEFGNFEKHMQNWMREEPGVTWERVYTEPQVRALLAGVKDSLTAAPAVPQGWIAVGERLPEPGRPVLLDIGKKHPIRAMWAARFTLEAGDDDPDWGEYDEDGDMYYCPQGWYEWNEHEDTHWRVHADPIRWAELTQPPKEQADAQ